MADSDEHTETSLDDPDSHRLCIVKHDGGPGNFYMGVLLGHHVREHKKSGDAMEIEVLSTNLEEVRTFMALVVHMPVGQIELGNLTPFDSEDYNIIVSEVCDVLDTYNISTCVPEPSDDRTALESACGLDSFLDRLVVYEMSCDDYYVVGVASGSTLRDNIETTTRAGFSICADQTLDVLNVILAIRLISTLLGASTEKVAHANCVRSLNDQDTYEHRLWNKFSATSYKKTEDIMRDRVEEYTRSVTQPAAHKRPAVYYMTNRNEDDYDEGYPLGDEDSDQEPADAQDLGHDIEVVVSKLAPRKRRVKNSELFV